MAGLKTEFLDGTRLFYPLESLPALFKTVGAVSRKGFYEKLAEIDGVGGEGLSLETITEMIRIGLQWENPTINYDAAFALVKKFYEVKGYEALESVIIDAFAGSGLSDQMLVEKRRAYLTELKELDLRALEFEIERKRAFLENRKAELPNPPKLPTGVDMGGRAKPAIKSQTRKRKT